MSEGQHEANMNNMAGGMQTVMAQIAAIRQENIDLKELVTTQYDVMRDELLRLRRVIGRVANRPVMVNHVENPNTRLLLISCSQGILSSSSFSCYLLLRLLVYMYLSQLMRTFTNYLKCIVISS